MAEQQVTQEVHDYLSAQGSKSNGGQRVKELIQAGKEALGEETDSEDQEFDTEEDQ